MLPMKAINGLDCREHGHDQGTRRLCTTSFNVTFNFLNQETIERIPLQTYSKQISQPINSDIIDKIYCISLPLLLLCLTKQNFNNNNIYIDEFVKESNGILTNEDIQKLSSHIQDKILKFNFLDM